MTIDVSLQETLHHPLVTVFVAGVVLNAVAQLLTGSVALVIFLTAGRDRWTARRRRDDGRTDAATDGPGDDRIDRHARAVRANLASANGGATVGMSPPVHEPVVR